MKQKARNKFGILVSVVKMNQANADAVVAGLSALRNEQRALAEKISDLQSDLNEHR